MAACTRVSGHYSKGLGGKGRSIWALLVRLEYGALRFNCWGPSRTARKHKGRKQEWALATMTGSDKHSLCAICHARSNPDSLMGSPAGSLQGKPLSILWHLGAPKTCLFQKNIQTHIHPQKRWDHGWQREFLVQFLFKKEKKQTQEKEMVIVSNTYGAKINTQWTISWRHQKRIY